MAEASFPDFFQTDPLIDQDTANRITQYYSEDIALPLSKQQSELLQLENKLESLKSSHSNQPVYWFLNGLNHRNLASYYSEINNPELADSHIHSKDIAYKKAIELDSSPPQKLSASIYSTMKYGLPQDLKIQATQKELSLGGSGDSDSAYWYLHWSNIDQLKKAGRHKEAEQAFLNMQKEMKEDKVDMSVYSTLNQTIEKSISPPAQNKTAETRKKPDTEVNRQPAQEASSNKKLIIISSILAFSFISLVAITFYEIKIKKKKTH